MKRITIILLSFVISVSTSKTGYSQHEGHGAGGVSSSPPHEKVINYNYICPMHPDVLSDNPGACYKCGMNLVRKKVAESKRSSKVYFYCPEHTSFQQAKKGTCTQCGKKLKKEKIFIYD